MVQFRKDKKRNPWVAQVRNHTGKRETASFPTKEMATEYELHGRKKRQAIRRGIKTPRARILFFDFSQKWIRKRYQGAVTLGTVDQDDRRLRKYWLEKIGSLPIDMISTAEILKHLDYIQFELGHSPADRNRHRALLHKLFQDAFMEERVEINPVTRIPLVKEIRVRKRVDVKDDAAFEEYLKAMLVEGPQYAVLGYLMGFTGCRVGEAVALQWRDVSFDRGVILFRRIEERAQGSKIVERTKGTGAVGGDEDALIIPLLPRLREALKSHFRWSKFTDPKDFIACHPKTGEYTRYDIFKDAHKRAVESAKITAITPHSIRRYFGTAAKKAGFTRAEIRELLGHSSEVVTARYDLKDIEHLREKAERLGFGGAESVKVVKLRGGKRK